MATQAREYNKFFCYRYFWLLAEDGTELVKIEAVFALMDPETRKVSSVPDEIVVPFGSEKIKRIKRYPKITIYHTRTIFAVSGTFLRYR